MKKGVVTLSLLLLMGGVLTLLLLLDQQRLKFLLAETMLRKQYVATSLALQQLSQAEKQQRCAEIPFEFNSKNKLITSPQTVSFSLPNQAPDGITHYVSCEFYSLFKQQPSKNNYEGEFDSFINATAYQNELSPPQLLPNNGKPYLYWLTKEQTTLTIQNNFDGIIIAEGNLFIQGKGKIRGSIITGAKLSLAEGVSLAYNRNIVVQLYLKYSRWQYAQKSWYDFTPQKRSRVTQSNDELSFIQHFIFAI